MAAPHRIRTKHLSLDPLLVSDLNEVHALWSEESVREFLWDSTSITRERSRALLLENEARFERQHYGMWGLRRRDKKRPELVGFCGFWSFHDPPEWQLVYGLAPEARGEGLATEAVKAMIRHGLRELRFARVLASADADNAASLAVLERAGMQFERRVEILGRDTVYYSIAGRR